MDLVHGALPRRLVRSPAQQLRAVTKTAPTEVVVTDLDHKLRLKRLPLRRTFRRPTARAVKPGAATSFSSFAVSAFFSSLLSEEVKPTWLSKPCSSYKPSRSEPTVRRPSL